MLDINSALTVRASLHFVPYMPLTLVPAMHVSVYTHTPVLSAVRKRDDKYFTRMIVNSIMFPCQIHRNDLITLRKKKLLCLLIDDREW